MTSSTVLIHPDQSWAESRDSKTVGLDGGALAIADGVFQGIEGSGKRSNPVPVEWMNAVPHDAECAEEGKVSSRRMLRMRLPGGLAAPEDGCVNPLKSCP